MFPEWHQHSGIYRCTSSLHSPLGPRSWGYKLHLLMLHSLSIPPSSPHAQSDTLTFLLQWLWLADDYYWFPLPFPCWKRFTSRRLLSKLNQGHTNNHFRPANSLLITRGERFLLSCSPLTNASTSWRDGMASSASHILKTSSEMLTQLSAGGSTWQLTGFGP